MIVGVSHDIGPSLVIGAVGRVDELPAVSSTSRILRFAIFLALVGVDGGISSHASDVEDKFSVARDSLLFGNLLR